MAGSSRPNKDPTSIFHPFSKYSFEIQLILSPSLHDYKMEFVNVVNTSRPLAMPLRVGVCNTFFTRLRGLTFHPPLAKDQGILLVQARDSRIDSAIHMVGVTMDLGVVWVNSGFRVVDLILARSWRTIHMPKTPARYIIECRPDRLDEFQQGDELKFEDLPI